jgi:hypothetical protein
MKTPDNKVEQGKEKGTESKHARDRKGSMQIARLLGGTGDSTCRLRDVK